jgi:hypothetical protein
MSSSLYNEAIEAAEQIKLAAEEKAKKQIIESISPQIKLMVEKKLFEEESKETSEECGSYEYSSERVDEEDCASEDQEEKVDELSRVELNAESRRVLNKLINTNSQRESVLNKIVELREGLASIQKAIILAESSVESRASAGRIAVLYKKLVNEIANLKSNSIFKKDTDLLKEFYILNKELQNMSIRRKNRRYLNENLQDLLEMDLFEAEGDEEGDDMDDMGDMDSKDMGDEPMDDESMEEDLEGMSAKDLANELDKLSGELSDLSSSARGLGGESADMSEDSDEDADEDADEGDLELDLAGLFESEEDVDPEAMGDDVDETLSARKVESRRNSGDVILEIDERMLKREISKMKNLREGEAKEMASHFGGGSVDGEVFVDGVELNKLHEIKMKAAKVVRMNRMLERKLSQHKKALRKMKGQLTEMNLFNAKLLYANKLMQNRDLSINQQKNIVESLDGAKNISEAKILFESLTKSLSGKKRTGNRRLSEGSLRRTRGSSSQPVKSAQTINENVALDRWATLAGIKK